jgi:NADH dehydrogenase
MHRTYHVSRMPTFNRKVRVIADWSLALFFRREIVSLGALQNPREEFEMAARPPLPSGSAEKPRPPRKTAARRPPKRTAS